MASCCVFWTFQSQNDNIWQVFNLLLKQFQCYLWSQVIWWVSIKCLYRPGPTKAVFWCPNSWGKTNYSLFMQLLMTLSLRRKWEMSTFHFFADIFSIKLSTFAVFAVRFSCRWQHCNYFTTHCGQSLLKNYDICLRSIPSPSSRLHCHPTTALHKRTQKFPPSKAHAWLNQILCGALWVHSCLAKDTCQVIVFCNKLTRMWFNRINSPNYQK